MQSPAVQLFCRAGAPEQADIQPRRRTCAGVADLVARLEGIPLALELAAARVRSLTVAEINNRLKDRYKILTGGARVLQERQQTLRALVDWSFDLLNPPEQTLFARLGVFVGGFDLDAAEQVCGVDPLRGRRRARSARFAGRQVAGPARRARKQWAATACSRRFASTRARSCKQAG